MSYRVLEWVDDESRSYGGLVYTVFEVAPDGTEQEVLEARDSDDVEISWKAKTASGGRTRNNARA